MEEIDLKQSGVTAKGELHKCMLSFYLRELTRATLYRLANDFKERLRSKQIEYEVEYKILYGLNPVLLIKPILHCMEGYLISRSHTLTYNFRDTTELQGFKDYVFSQERKDIIDEILTDLETNPIK